MYTGGLRIVRTVLHRHGDTHAGMVRFKVQIGVDDKQASKGVQTTNTDIAIYDSPKYTADDDRSAMRIWSRRRVFAARYSLPNQHGLRFFVLNIDFY